MCPCSAQLQPHRRMDNVCPPPAPEEGPPAPGCCFGCCDTPVVEADASPAVLELVPHG